MHEEHEGGGETREVRPLAPRSSSQLIVGTYLFTARNRPTTLPVMEQEMTSPWGKAKKKVPIAPAAVKVETAPAAVGEQETLSQTEIEALLDELRALLPLGYRPFIPGYVPPQGGKAVTDFERLLSQLNLPQFAVGFSPNWEKFFARVVGDKQQLIACLSALFEAGYGPENRASDVYQASWLLLYATDLATDDGGSANLVVDDYIIEAGRRTVWSTSRLPSVRTSLATIAAGSAASAWNPQSVLKRLGYRVGANGKSAGQRKSILLDAALLPVEVIPKTQVKLWGNPGTRHRILAIRKMLDLFIRLAKSRQHHDMTKACKNWEEDLRWIDAGLAAGRLSET